MTKKQDDTKSKKWHEKLIAIVRRVDPVYPFMYTAAVFFAEVLLEMPRNLFWLLATPGILLVFAILGSEGEA